MIYLYVALAVLAAVVVTGYLQPKWSWTGLRDDTKRPKTLWDWLGLLIIPLVIAAGGYAINQAQTSREREKADADDKQAKKLAAEVRRDDSLRAYLQQMSGLVAQNDLAGAVQRGNASLAGLAQSLTLTVLRQLDGQRRGQVAQFLVDAKLITKPAVIELYGANLRDAKLRGAILEDADFTGADLGGADLHDAVINGADFSASNLRKTDFSGTGTVGAKFSDSCLTGAKFTGANLEKASFTETQARGVDFSHAFIEKSNFRGAALSNVDATDTTYGGATESTFPEGWRSRGVPVPTTAAVDTDPCELAPVASP